MNYNILIGGILFGIDSPLHIDWRPEEQSFFWSGEHYLRSCSVHIQLVSALPQLIQKEAYAIPGMRIGYDANGNEVRYYSACFMGNDPVYACSVLHGSDVEIYFIDDRSMWRNPNIRLWNMVHMERLLLSMEAMVLHCSYVVYDGKAILFSAPSGTGKTTQAKLWEKLYPARIINGDKAIISKKDGVWHACGYPFHGTAPECFNEDYPIGAIVIVRQNKKDYIEALSLLSRLKFLYSETTVPAWDASAINRTADLLTDLAGNVEVVCQQCTMNDTACHTLHRYLKGN